MTETEDLDPRWIAGEDVAVEGGIARPYKGSTMLLGYWHAEVDGVLLHDGFGWRMFEGPEEVEAFLAGAALRQAHDAG